MFCTAPLYRAALDRYDLARRAKGGCVGPMPRRGGSSATSSLGSTILKRLGPVLVSAAAAAIARRIFSPSTPPAPAPAPIQQATYIPQQSPAVLYGLPQRQASPMYQQPQAAAYADNLSMRYPEAFEARPALYNMVERQASSALQVPSPDPLYPQKALGQLELQVAQAASQQPARFLGGRSPYGRRKGGSIGVIY